MIIVYLVEPIGTTLQTQKLIVEIHLWQEQEITLNEFHAAHVEVEYVQVVLVEEAVIVAELVGVRVAVEVEDLVEGEDVLEGVGVDEVRVGLADSWEWRVVVGDYADDLLVGVERQGVVDDEKVGDVAVQLGDLLQVGEALDGA